MAVDMILPAICILLIWVLSRSYRRDPFAYANIVITGIIMLVMALIIGRGVFSDAKAVSGMFIVTEAVDFLWRFSRFLFIPITFICLFACVSNAELLRKEGFCKGNLLGLIGCAVYLVTINVIWRPINELPMVVNGVMIFARLILCYLECTFLSICLNGYAVTKIEPAYDRDFVIILGCSISKKGKVRPLLKARVNRAIKYAWEQEIRTGKAVKYVPSGGQGSDEPISEASAMELYLLSHSAEDYEVFPEKRSTNTFENLTFSKAVIEERMKNAKVAIVTTHYHVLRSGMLSRMAGLTDAAVIGSGTKWYFWPNAFLRETVAIFFMFPKVHAGVAAVCAVAAAFAAYMN
ncbi:MAG: YdcF family protein [Lachnospiraceae bacterium]|nr:YdcF family protein [Lachnospiraceae bacterium]